MDFFRKKLIEFEKNELYRKIKDISYIEGKFVYTKEGKILDLASNNYLGLRDEPRIKEAVIKGVEKYGAGSGASRLVNGTADIYKEFEYEISKFKKKEDALIFNSGYNANIGIIQAIYDKNDIIFSDKLNHASIIDGIKLSTAKMVRYKHLDYNDLENKLIKYRQNHKKALIITDTIFSMDGDRADLKKIVELKERYNCLLMIDEAHATGVLGENGAGLAEEEDVLDKIDISMGTLGKAFGLEGAYAVCSHDIKNYLVNTCRSFIYTTAINPGTIAGAIKALEIIKREKFRREKILKLACKFREKLDKKSYNTMESKSQIVPILIGENKNLINFANKLMKNGIYAGAIRYPTVAKNSARLRFSINYNIENEDIDFILDKI